MDIPTAIHAIAVEYNGAPALPSTGADEPEQAVWKTGRMRTMHQRVGSQGVSDRRHFH